MSLDSALLGEFVIFCRVGSCIMTLPGFSASHIPVRIRLYAAFAATLALSPLLWDSIERVVIDAPLSQILPVILGELLLGSLIGLSARLFFLALEALATFVAMTIGLGNLLGSIAGDSEASPAMASFVVLCATVLIFVSDQHFLVIEGLFTSYRTMPITGLPETAFIAKHFLRALEESFFLALRICSPFLLFGVTINFGFGILNRMAPQAQVYFLTTPLLIALGLYLFAQISHDLFSGFSNEFGSWLAYD
jgi:flagellar biosynthetic protein FliR